jgi:Right handed beta helix region
VGPAEFLAALRVSRTVKKNEAMISTDMFVGPPRSVASRPASTRQIILALAFVWPCVRAPDIRASEYWVGPRGRDAAGQGSQARPLATLQYAADRVRAGDTVHVLDGDYTGFNVTRGGTADADVVFKADGKRVRIVRRNRNTPDGINIEGAGNVVIDGFIVNDMPRAGVRAVGGSHITIRRIRASHNGVWGILTGHCDDLAIINNQVSNSVKEHGIYVGNSGDRPVIGGNISWGNRGCGIHMNGDKSQGGDGIISDAVVESNLIFENGNGGGSGINCDGVQDSRFQNNLLYNNHASGISLYRIDGGAASTGNSVINNTIDQAADARWAVNIASRSINNVIANNILFHNGSNGGINVAADSLPGLRSDYNIVVDRFSPDNGGRFVSLAEWRSLTGLDRHSKVSKPQDVFVNLESNDYHLRDGSPALDAADPERAPPLDIHRRTRPVGAGPDIGAFETADRQADSRR